MVLILGLGRPSVRSIRQRILAVAQGGLVDDVGEHGRRDEVHGRNAEALPRCSATCSAGAACQSEDGIVARSRAAACTACSSEACRNLGARKPQP